MASKRREPPKTSTTRATPEMAPKCARCGYSFYGIMGTTCPECGAELEEESVLPPVRPPAPEESKPTRRDIAGGVFVACATALLGIGFGLYFAIAGLSGNITKIPLYRDEWRLMRYASVRPWIGATFYGLMTVLLLLGAVLEFRRVRAELRARRVGTAPDEPEGWVISKRWRVASLIGVFGAMLWRGYRTQPGIPRLVWLGFGLVALGWLVVRPWWRAHAKPGWSWWQRQIADDNERDGRVR